MSEPLFKAGTVFHGPGGQGYRLTCDVYVGDVARKCQFEAFGGAPEPEQDTPLPTWLVAELFKVHQ